MRKYLILLILLVITGCGKEKELKCYNGYILDNNMCKKEINNSIAEVSYYCDETYELKDLKCKKYQETDIKEKDGCIEGLKEVEGKCVTSIAAGHRAGRTDNPETLYFAPELDLL